MTSQESFTHIESENKANRETIQRLVNEINKFEKDSVQNKLLFEQIKAVSIQNQIFKSEIKLEMYNIFIFQERDAALTSKSTLEKEIEVLKERVTSIQTAWTSTKAEMEKRESVLNEHNANLKKLEYEALYEKNSFGAFKEQVANLLSDGVVKVEANEEQIKEKIQLLMKSSKDRGLVRH